MLFFKINNDLAFKSKIEANLNNIKLIKAHFLTCNDANAAESLEKVIGEVEKLLINFKHLSKHEAEQLNWVCVCVINITSEAPTIGRAYDNIQNYVDDFRNNINAILTKSRRLRTLAELAIGAVGLVCLGIAASFAFPIAIPLVAIGAVVTLLSVALLLQKNKMAGIEKAAKSFCSFWSPKGHSQDGECTQYVRLVKLNKDLPPINREHCNSTLTRHP